MPFAKPIMIQGTASHVGKSVLVTALCRIFAQDGYRVAPFKSQNMALNSFVTAAGGEIGRAQAVQAEAAGIAPSTLMNPILLKPTSDLGAQVIVNGRVSTNMSAIEYHTHKKRLEKEAIAAYRQLADNYDVIVIEGAGSPAEINLKEHDIVNMRMAQLADAPVIITGDIDKGGVFASLIGTWELLTPVEREQVKALHINKFRGDVNILRPGLDFLTGRVGRPLLGVTPYIRDIGIQEEDSLPIDRINRGHKSQPALLRVQIPTLPHLSNFTDFDPLEKEEGVELRYLKPGESFDWPDLIILPGTKNTSADFRYLQEMGYTQQIERYAREGIFILGICGGYQMLGEKILDPAGVESTCGEIAGLGLLPVVTCFAEDKVTAQVTAQSLNLPFYQGTVTGYEIHMGRSQISGQCFPIFVVERDGDKHPDGAGILNYRIMGTYLHGLFDNDAYRRSYLNFVRQGRGKPVLDDQAQLAVYQKRQEAYDRLAKIVRDSLDMRLLYAILNKII
ncbi:MAG: cobyric acid synthase [Candidatus Schekmanbacteria bacterium]|nr:cobyric acid synthase [Candidatus Schekmanbacteria bacterium]